MARPTLAQNPKWRRLLHALGGNQALARGSLELLWEVAYQSGNEVIGDSVDVELAAGWSGEPGVLTKALLEAGGPGRAGFIEEVRSEPGRYQVHDLWDHAPRFVANRAEKEAEREQRGETISSIRASAGRKGAATRWQTDDVCHPTGGKRGGKRKQGASTHAPAHALAHEEALSPARGDEAAPPDSDLPDAACLPEVVSTGSPPPTAPEGIEAQPLGDLPEQAERLPSLPEAPSPATQLAAAAAAAGDPPGLSPRELGELHRKQLESDCPLTMTLLVELERRGFEAWPPKDPRAKRDLERVVETVSVSVAADRLMALVEADRAKNVVTRPWLGFHRDLIAGEPARTSFSSAAGKPKVTAPAEQFAPGVRRVTL